ncbi:TIGR03862 family flavoprotein [Pseudooceanicola sp. 216_PA32_1]|uniref:TIGR03862 family flavoprotein n=2 Tax=Pseudooceanicola pacificus TaxID=2676438 RepID=A0A844VYV3_9RHOB|nr:TIGR03862 family flavoprotein [Pseudooceanicola pacificus]
MAASVMARAGLGVTVAERMPTVGRKLLMAGKSGLNLTKDEDDARVLAAYPDCPAPLARALADFGPQQAMDWARGLGQEVFTGSTGRVFPKAMKASPLLRAWLAELRGLGTTFNTRWRWTGRDGAVHLFDTPDGEQRLHPEVTVLALGGASWGRLGSDGAWSAQIADTAPFAASNAGLRLDWSDKMAPHFGSPLKAVAFTAGEIRSRGEAVLTPEGIEGGGVYALSPAIRAGAAVTLDLCPDVPLSALAAKLSRRRRGDSLANHLRRAVGLDSLRRALLMEWGRPLPDDLGPLLKALPVPVRGLAPIDRAISTAGGLRFDALDDRLMLRESPGTFAAGEMLDWDAPTGGYLLTACLATGRMAGLAAVDYAAACRSSIARR